MRKTWICTLLAAVAAAPAFPLDWMTDFDAAKAQAAKEGKPILVDFTGSDWCGFCIKLKKQVFDTPEFDAYAKDKFVCLEIDLPHGNKISEEQKKANEALSEQYNVDGFPSIFVMTPQGYVVGGFSGFHELADAKEALDTGLANAKAVADAQKLEGDARVDAMFAVYKGLDEDLAPAAQSLRDAIAQMDTNDRCGMRRGKQAAEEMNTLQEQLRKGVEETGSAGLKDVLAKLEAARPALLPENSHAAVQMKTSIMFLLCESQEDLDKLRDTIVADLKALDPAHANPEQVKQDIERVTQIAKDGQRALDYAKNSRAELDDRAAAAKEAKREEEEEARLQAAGAAKLVWGTDLAAAKAQAAKENKPILLVFTGSDWCGACIALHQEVFEKLSFAAYAKERFIPVEIDCPHGNKMSEEQKKANNALAEEFHVEGFPTILVLNPQGVVSGGFVGGQEMADVKADLETALANVKKLADAQSLQPEARLKVLTTLYNELDEDVAPCAASLEAEITKLDPEDKSGFRHGREIAAKRAKIEEMTQQFLEERGVDALPELVKACDEQLPKIEPELKLDIITTKANALMLAAESKEDLQKACDTLEGDLKGVDRAVSDPELYKACEEALQSWREKADAVLQEARQMREILKSLRNIQQEQE